MGTTGFTLISKRTKCFVFLPLPEVLPGDTETRLFLVRFDCWGVGEWRVLGGGVAGDDGLCLRLGGLAEGDSLRVFRGGLDVLLGGFFGGDRERDEEDEELLPDNDAEERLLLQKKAFTLSPASLWRITSQYVQCTQNTANLSNF